MEKKKGSPPEADAPSALGRQVGAEPPTLSRLRASGVNVVRYRTALHTDIDLAPFYTKGQVGARLRIRKR